jgi:hypothetical protein
MDVTFDWEDAEHTILRQTVRGNLSIDDLGSLRDLSRQFTGSLDHQIHLIVDFSQATFGAMLSGMPSLSRNSIFKEDDVGIVVMVGMRTFMRAVLDIFRKVYPGQAAKLRTADTLDEARLMLQQARQK